MYLIEFINMILILLLLDELMFMICYVKKDVKEYIKFIYINDWMFVVRILLVMEVDIL